ncbi:MAG: hypothetical protein P8N07_04795 [Flavobacteriales bacterium]|nr:hypothetical protein [Flavobacteriales bacterium]
MPKLLIYIEVNNPDEVIANEKGKLIGLASKLLSKENRKVRVEQQVFEALHEELGEGIMKELDKKGIDSVIKVEIVE